MVLWGPGGRFCGVCKAEVDCAEEDDDAASAPPSQEAPLVSKHTDSEHRLTMTGWLSTCTDETSALAESPLHSTRTWWPTAEDSAASPCASVRKPLQIGWLAGGNQSPARFLFLSMCGEGAFSSHPSVSTRTSELERLIKCKIRFERKPGVTRCQSLSNSLVMSPPRSPLHCCASLSASWRSSNLSRIGCDLSKNNSSKSSASSWLGHLSMPPSMLASRLLASGSTADADAGSGLLIEIPNAPSASPQIAEHINS
mmetsp:Transcript_99635/g.257653  ORF Transcript_99635/g.257653 Transcript_99635/m.257653 type:complete len:255 (-) Transcript_99635:894-1658(-)